MLEAHRLHFAGQWVRGGYGRYQRTDNEKSFHFVLTNDAQKASPKSHPYPLFQNSFIVDGIEAPACAKEVGRLKASCRIDLHVCETETSSRISFEGVDAEIVNAMFVRRRLLAGKGIDNAFSRARASESAKGVEQMDDEIGMGLATDSCGRCLARICGPPFLASPCGPASVILDIGANQGSLREP